MRPSSTGRLPAILGIGNPRDTLLTSSAPEQGLNLTKPKNSAQEVAE
jgi:hypothetical protein